MLHQRLASAHGISRLLQLGCCLVENVFLLPAFDAPLYIRRAVHLEWAGPTTVRPVDPKYFAFLLALWLQPDIVPARIGISTASIFSLLALGFSIRLRLPAVSYMTRADIFVIGCTLLVFVALGVAVIGSRWASSDRMEQALRLNAIARWAYVGLFGLVATIAMTM